MKYYKITNCKEGSIPWVFESKDLDHFKNLIKDHTHLLIEEISKKEFEKEVAE